MNHRYLPRHLGIQQSPDKDKAISQEMNSYSNSKTSMWNLLNKVKGYLGVDPKFQTYEQRFHRSGSEVYLLFGNNSLLKELTKYRPEVSVDEGLRTTCDWFKKPENRSKYKASVYNI